jgi:phosphoserine phosphatase
MIVFTACGQAGSVPQGAPNNTDQSVTASTSETGEQAYSTESSKAVTESGEVLETTDDTAKTGETLIPYWTEDSEVMKSIVSYVGAVSNESSEIFVPEEDRIAVFDFDGTLYGELFPTYFDETLLLHRVLHDDTFKADPELLAYAEASEEAYMKGLPQPDTDISTSASLSDSFKGMTVDEYRDYIRKFMEEPVWGFEGMTYGEGFYMPMISLVQYLAEHGFKVFISSGSERSMVRELIEGTLDEWIPSERIIGSTYSMAATGQGDEKAKSYTYKMDDQVLLEGQVVDKNQKMAKVISIVNEIGKPPVLVFGNSSGDLAMAQYAVQNGGRGYMLLCDDTERDYGNLVTAEQFAKDCEKIGLETVSMKNDFATIYKEGANKVVPESWGESNADESAASEEAPAA